MNHYQVLVGNIGQVYEGYNQISAWSFFNDYKRMSQNNTGRAGNENVYLTENEEIIEEHFVQ